MDGAPITSSTFLNFPCENKGALACLRCSDLSRSGRNPGFREGIVRLIVSFDVYGIGFCAEHGVGLLNEIDSRKLSQMNLERVVPLLRIGV